MGQVALQAGAIASTQVAKHLDELRSGLVCSSSSATGRRSQATIGFKYALNDGYDVRKMVDMFQILQRVSGEHDSGGSPLTGSWPDQGDRSQT
jgi:hypothetical protein